jgi:hypothetical protein
MADRTSFLCNIRHRKLIYGCSLLLLMGWMSACKKEETPVNPYDAVDYSSGNENDTVPDPASITGLHKNIFFPKCANPGCHDGTFEPDFRTVQSTYSTLVFMGVNKTTLDSISFFNYRVLPGDLNNSFLMERLLTTTSDYMPSNGVRLPNTDIDNIREWLLDSCPDINGNLPQKPNLPPNIIGFIATDQSFVRLDTIRVGGIPFNSFIVPANSIFYLPIVALDTADGVAATDPANFTLSQVRLSTNKDDFSSALTMNATWFSPIPFAVWQCTVNTAVWTAGTTVYFRIYVNDGFQSSPAEFPKSSSLDYFKTYYSFIIQ